jgi:hypothetical protein
VSVVVVEGDAEQIVGIAVAAIGVAFPSDWSTRWNQFGDSS